MNHPATVNWTERYAADLARLPELGRNHARNVSLLPIAHRALRAGRTVDEAVAEIVAASGEPPLTDCEVRRALVTAAAAQSDGRRGAGRPSRPPTPGERGFVAAMVAYGRGFTEESFATAATRGAAGDRAGSARVHVKALAQPCAEGRFDPADAFWVGRDKGRGGLTRAGDLIRDPGLGGDVPNFITCNALTGARAPKKDGTGVTLRGDNCVKAKKFLLLEFDNLSREEQLAFFGAVMEKGFFRVVTLVDSGNKSIHGLVGVEGEYGAFRERVQRLCCSSADERYRADRAVMHPAALTRLAGGWRADTGKVQKLIYVARPSH